MPLKILKMRRYGDEDTLIVIDQDVAQDVTQDLVRQFMWDNCPIDETDTVKMKAFEDTIKTLHLVDDGDIETLDDYGVLAEIVSAKDYRQSNII